jgi:hypothetical protein
MSAESRQSLINTRHVKLAPAVAQYVIGRGLQ